MKLYRLTILGYQQNIERGVWADQMLSEGSTYYFKVGDDIVASYPIGKTIITNIETEEAYEERKKREAETKSKFK